MKVAWEIPHNTPCPLLGFIELCTCAQIWVSLVYMGGCQPDASGPGS